METPILLGNLRKLLLLLFFFFKSTGFKLNSMKLKNLLTVLFISAFTFGVMAQHKLTKKADNAFQKGFWNAAIENYTLALKREKDAEIKLRIMYNMAQSYAGAKEYKNAVTWFKKIEKKGKNFVQTNPEVLLKLGHAYKSMEEYEKAMNSYMAYSDLKPDDANGKKGSKSCELAIKWNDKPTRYKVENVRQLNSKYDDAIPAYSNKRYKELVYQSYRAGAIGKGDNPVSGQAFPDIYTSKLAKNGKWSTPAPITGDEKVGVNTKFAEGGPSMNVKMNTLYFTRCKNFDGKEKKEKSCQIYKSVKRGQDYAEAEMLMIGNDSLIVAHPTLTNKDQTLYFVSNMKGGIGGKDIWVADYDKKEKKWVNIRNLGTDVNTPGDELYPFVHADGTLYFSSNGHVGIGGFDIFKVEKLKDGWGPVQNMKVPINSSSDDISITFEKEAERGYLTSNRSGGRGRMDVWSFNLPKLVICVSGVVKDKLTKEYLPNSKVVIRGSDGSTFDAITDETGAYKFCLKPNTTYQIQAENDKTKMNKFGTEFGVYFTSEKALISTIGVEESRTMIQDLELERIPDDGIELPNIEYEYNKADLKAISKLKLRDLVRIMKENPGLVIELGSHSDFRGSADYNRDLALRRAEAAVKFLVSEGIVKDRMVPNGYGEDAPRKIDSTYVQKAYFGTADAEPTAKDYSSIDGRTKEKVSASFADQKATFVPGVILNEAFIKLLKSNGLVQCAHQMNRRTEFKVLRTDYKPGQTAQGEVEKK
jgi:peptidoglycan-associated lipoprotein